VAPALTELAPVIFARDGLALGAEGMIQAANMYLQGHEYAKSPLDLALWDLTARAAGLPLHAFPGGCSQSGCRYIIRFPVLRRTKWRASPPRRQAAVSPRSG
jgi:L-alanine-DL-glutamate epimerase-like enolase superfamily enzyme